MKTSAKIVIGTGIAAGLAVLAIDAWWPHVFAAISRATGKEASTCMWFAAFVLWSLFYSGASTGAAESKTMNKD